MLNRFFALTVYNLLVFVYWPTANAQDRTFIPELAAQEVTIEGVRGWIFIPELTVREVYTDNIALAPSGFEESDYVTEITPGFILRRDARRYKLEVDYALQNLIYLNDSDRNDLIHLLRADANGELVRDNLFVDMTADFGQQNISSRNVALDNISFTGARRDVLTYSVSPYWIQRFGSFSLAELRYRFREVEIDADQAEIGRDSESDEFLLHIENGPRFTRLLWDVDYRREDIDFQRDGRETQFQTLGAGLRYLLTRKWALIAGGGFDENDFATRRRDASGPFWNIGASWTPNPRTTLEATYGERFFGSSVFVNLKHETKRTQWVVSFTQEPALTRRVLIERRAFSTVDAITGDRIPDPTTAEFRQLDVNVPDQTNEVFIRSRLNTSFRYTLTRNQIEISVFDEQREFQSSGNEDSTTGGFVTWIHELGPYTASTVRLLASTNEFQGDLFREDRQDDFIILDIGVTHQLARQLEASIGYRYAERESDRSDFGFEENRVFAYLTKAF